MFWKAKGSHIPSFILRHLDPEFWSRVQAKAKADGTTVKAVILKLLTQWLGVLVALLLLSACAPPLAPSPLQTDVVVTAAPASIVLTVSPASLTSDHLLTLEVHDATGTGVAGVTVSLTTTAGTVTKATVLTGPTGQAQASLHTTENATVTARIGDVVTIAHASAYREPAPPTPPTFTPPPPVVITPPPATCATTPALCPAPTLTASLTCTPRPSGSPTPCNVTASWGSTPLHGAAITEVIWDWADGTAVETTAAPINAHTYAQAGTYTIYAAVTAETPSGSQEALASRVLVIP